LPQAVHGTHACDRICARVRRIEVQHNTCDHRAKLSWAISVFSLLRFAANNLAMRAWRAIYATTSSPQCMVCPHDWNHPSVDMKKHITTQEGCTQHFTERSNTDNQTQPATAWRRSPLHAMLLRDGRVPGDNGKHGPRQALAPCCARVLCCEKLIDLLVTTDA
jgi:hypothetical protein